MFTTSQALGMVHQWCRPQGKRLQNGRSWNSRDISEAQSMIDSYLREQDSGLY
ncbi:MULTISPECIES: hypothetical protein [Leptolyngbya]|uniref:hypothetical protein n=1 Tax=Leptolyngbya TaxID=47251 RepID=UPI001F5581C1|nr:hypothetical protein [Leptolyngbya sp. FACHB-1624]